VPDPNRAQCVSSVVILVADGLTPAALDSAISDGDVPELAAMKLTGGYEVITTAFPSVTGVAYVPMLTGLHPGDAGVPGLRWYDRSRRLPALIGHSRSYVGTQLRAINDDLSPQATTAFELAGGSALGAASVVTRGLPRDNQLDRGVWNSIRAVRAHFTGDVDRWASLEQQVGETLIARIRRERPRFVFAAFTAGDKATHAGGIKAAGVRRSLVLVDTVAAAIRRDAEADGRWDTMHLMVVSDHGHSGVTNHFDLADAVREMGVRVRSHPWTVPDRSDVAVMVSGNSMAHVYLGLEERNRPDWPALQTRWNSTLDAIAMHPAVDIIGTRHSSDVVHIRRRDERAEIVVGKQTLSYRADHGNPLGIDPFENLCDLEVYERSVHSCYPDSLLQLAVIVRAERSGDLVISAAPNWDFRQRYEPIDHVSSHGALHAAHMLVPLLSNRSFVEKPRRTSDLFRFLSLALDRKR
jgi:hypothetical protein